jgi:broad specificity phosphatase PhoE
MKIGLIRHFRVDLAYPKKWFVSKTELVEWFDAYANAKILPDELDLAGIHWKHCYSSPLPRALDTARHIYQGEIQLSQELAELNILPHVNPGIRLPIMLWAIIMKIKSTRSNEATERFKTTLKVFMDELLEKKEDDVLIVSHGFVLMALRKELLKRGFTDHSFSVPEHGKVYMFERNT